MFSNFYLTIWFYARCLIILVNFADKSLDCNSGALATSYLDDNRDVKCYI